MKASILLDYESYKDKVKACWIGKNIGGTMGTPYEGCREILDINGFATKPGEPLPNDDLDLQLVWLHALENIGPHNINAANLGEMWLSFIVPHWNEYGIGKINMQRGLRPGVSGDFENDWRNSNGAWIRTEIWACTAPAIPELAVKFATEDAKVDHGAGEGTYAAAFVSAMQSAAFALDSLDDCINVALAAIPETCRVATSVRLVLDCYNSGKSWLETRNTVFEANKDIGDGWFEAPSNVAYTVIGLVYGEGDFKKSMITAINCGDDTDCTGATVGATLGILYGMAGIPEDWREYIGDSIITVSINRGEVGGSFPKSCTELSERVVAVAPAVMCAHNCGHIVVRNNFCVCFGKPTSAADNYTALIDRIALFVFPELEKLKENTMQFASAFLKADVTLSDTEIQPNGEINVGITFALDRTYDNKQYGLSLRWILPDGFTVEGKQNAILKRCEWSSCAKHGRGFVNLDFKLKAGENVQAANRIILEVTSPSRHTAMYISFLLLG